MRKPVVVVTLILALILSITLASHLAQPAIANEGSGKAIKVVAVTEVPVDQAIVKALPIRPSGLGLAEVKAEADVKTEVVKTGSRAVKATHRGGRAARSFVKSPQNDANNVNDVSEPLITPTPSYRALLGKPGAAFKTAKDHGSHDLGTPQWIESLSGAKGRVPVRDFAEESAKKVQASGEPFIMTVDSRVDSAR